MFTLLLHTSYSNLLKIHVDSMQSPKSALPLNPLDYISICNYDNFSYSDRKFGEIIIGEKLGYINENITCINPKPKKLTCKKKISETDFDKITKAIDNEYRLQFSIMGMPIASYTQSQFRFSGVPLGFKDGQDYLLRTKYIFQALCNAKYPVYAVQFDSVTSGDVYQILKSGQEIEFEYTLASKEPGASLSSTNRDPEFRISGFRSKIYLFLSFTITAVTVIASIWIFVQVGSADDVQNQDLYGYDDQSDFKVMDEIGWRLLHGDIFRSPQYPILLSSFVGVGFDFLISLLVVFIFTAIGIFEVISFSTFVEPFLLIYFIVTPINGFLSTKLFKTIGRQFWKRNLLTASLLGPCFFASLYLLLQFNLAGKESTASISLKYFLKTAFILTIGCFTFHFIGAIPALKGSPFEFPTTINQLPRYIPQQSFFHSTFVSMAVGGFQAFVIIALDFHLILESMWTGLSFFESWGHAALSLVLCVICSAGASVLSIYMSISNEDYRWWWKAFMTSAAGGIYIFIYSLGYAVFSIRPTFGGIMPYFIESTLMGFVSSLALGCSGFIGSFIFVCALYSALKME